MNPHEFAEIMPTANTQAILLLTAPLLAGRGASPMDLLTAGEYKRLARHLHAMQHQPADLLSTDAEDLLRVCQPIVDELKHRGLLSAAGTGACAVNAVIDG